MDMVRRFLEQNPTKQSYTAYWLNGYDRESLHALRESVESVVSYLSNSREKMVVLKLMDMPVLRSLWFQEPSHTRWLSWLMISVFPIGIPIWLYGRHTQAQLRDELATVVKVADELIVLIQK